jgi:hypothetical protein
MSERGRDFISLISPDLPAYGAYVTVGRAVSLSEWYELWGTMHKEDMPRTEREYAQRSKTIHRTTNLVLPPLERSCKEPWHKSLSD